MMPKTLPHQAALDRLRRLAVTAVVVAAGLTLPACTTSGAADAENPAAVEAVPGSEVKRVTLTEQASERLGIKTTPLTEETVAGKTKKIIPASAVIYDANGATWVYTTSRAHSFVRESITLQDLTADRAVLSAGPAAGTTVVSVGAAMLYGTELGVGE